MRTDLIRMANQIARQFEHLPAAQASAAVVTHLTAFWSPAMRLELLRCLTEEPEHLHPAVVAATEELRLLTPNPQNPDATLLYTDAPPHPAATSQDPDDHELRGVSSR